MVRRFFAITLLALGLAARPAHAGGDFSAHFIALNPPALLPRFTFEDAAGRTLDLTQFRGRYVLLNLWATWCLPCVHEMGSLDELTQKLGVTIVPLTEDHDGLGAAQAFYKRHNLTHLTVYVDTSGMAPSILSINGLPTTFLIGPDGKEIGRVEGEVNWSDPASIAFLQKQMQPKPVTPQTTASR